MKLVNTSKGRVAGRRGFTLVEVLVALAVSVSTVLIASSALMNVLGMEAAALRKSEAVLLLRSIECMEFANDIPAGIKTQAEKGWSMLEHRFEDDDRSWNAWQITPRDRGSTTWSVFFSVVE